MFSYSLETQQPLQGTSIYGRIDFANEGLQMTDVGDIQASQIVFFDETHFYLDSFVNKEN